MAANNPEDEKHSDTPHRSLSREALDSALITLGVNKLAAQVAKLNGQAVQSLASLGVAVALAIADVTARATVNPDVALALRGFRDYWWGPLPFLALAVFCFLFGTRSVEYATGPEVIDTRIKVEAFLRSNPAADRLTAFQEYLDGTETRNKLMAIGPSLWLQAGTVWVGAAIVVGVLLFAVVR